MDKFKIDGQKLSYHVGRVSGWMEGNETYPIYVEISPSRACNHRCAFCGLDFMQHAAKKLETAMLKERLAEMGRLGVKSVMYCGEGEPFMHRDIAEIVTHTKKVAGIDVGITTNGVLLTPALAEEILGSVEWIKVSINGGSSGTYAKIHNTKEADFDKVIANMKEARRIKDAAGHKCALGMQMLLLPENKLEAETLAKIARDIGMDYLVIKPYSQHPQSDTEIYRDINYDDYMYLSEELAKYNNDSFSVVFRINSIKKHDLGVKGYSKCLALPFMSYIDADGAVWGCLDFQADQRFYYGNIYDNSFQQIWEGEPRKKSMKWVETEMKLGGCRVNCRLDEVNRYLWSLKTPPQHVNFI
jgi:MoaA/NifB/PqqE/SkfB family radical SAM enzyme